ncbi:hypothetical protein [Pseudarthrobacter oxydans]|uniref:hypothetical protein n=1 Tax=Pseudarthrobacter oxydans TaxID=1671 RepID=UPI00380B3B1F
MIFLIWLSLAAISASLLWSALTYDPLPLAGAEASVADALLTPTSISTAATAPETIVLRLNKLSPYFLAEMPRPTLQNPQYFVKSIDKSRGC